MIETEVIMYFEIYNFTLPGRICEAFFVPYLTQLKNPVLSLLEPIYPEASNIFVDSERKCSK